MRRAWLIGVLIATTGCADCDDTVFGWELHEDHPERFEGDVGYDVSTDERGPNVDSGWVPEQVVPTVPAAHALNERTSLAVDTEGTIWLGYHACDSDRCNNPELALAFKRRGGDWQYERIKPQRGTFGIDVAVADQPMAAFLDPTDNSFKAALRVGPGQFEFHRFPVTRTSVSDGLDIARDGERMFITFANTQSDPASLFVYSRGEYQSLANLDIGNAQAALERGLASDGNGSLFLVHRRGRDQQWGVARYSLRAGTWDALVYYEGSYQPQHPSSMVVTDDGRTCITGDSDGQLALACGRMNLLAADVNRFDGEFFNGYSSMVKGADGTLYIAFNDAAADLRLAKVRPNGSAEFETVFQGETYGVSTAIDSEGLLVISYYTCAAGSCRLEVLSRAQN